MLKFLLYFDIFGKQLTFRMNDHNSHKNYIGTTLTIGLIILMSVMFYLNLIEVLNRSKPSILHKEQFDLLNSYNITEDPNSSLTFAILPKEEDLNGDAIYRFREDLIKIEFKIARTTLSKGGKREYFFEDVPLKYCEEKDFPNFADKDFFELNNLKYALCPTFRNFTIQGQFTSSDFRYLRISITNCKNTYVPFFSSNITCANDTKLMEDIGKLKFSFFYSFFMPNMLNSKDSLDLYMDSQGFGISASKRSNINMFFQNNEISTNDNFIFDKIEFYQIDNFQTYERMEASEQEIRIDEPVWFKMFYVRISSFKHVYYRSYKTIKGMLAELGGILSTSIMVLRIVSYLYKDDRFFLHVFENSNYISYNFQEPYIKINSTLNIDYSCNDNSDSLKTVRLTNKNKNNKIRVKSKFYSYLFCCKKDSKTNLSKYMFLKKKVSKAIDFISYINFYNEFEVFKSFILDNNQLKLFNSLKYSDTYKFNNDNKSLISELYLKESKSDIDFFLLKNSMLLGRID